MIAPVECVVRVSSDEEVLTKMLHTNGKTKEEFETQVVGLLQRLCHEMRGRISQCVIFVRDNDPLIIAGAPGSFDFALAERLAGIEIILSDDNWPHAHTSQLPGNPLENEMKNYADFVAADLK